MDDFERRISSIYPPSAQRRWLAIGKFLLNRGFTYLSGSHKFEKNRVFVDLYTATFFVDTFFDGVREEVVQINVDESSEEPLDTLISAIRAGGRQLMEVFELNEDH
jgi:hypothetical protein